VVGEGKERGRVGEVTLSRWLLGQGMESGRDDISALVAGPSKVGLRTRVNSNKVGSRKIEDTMKGFFGHA
jgi:hypothetical protein